MQNVDFAELKIKGMVCNRCIYLVKKTLIEHELSFSSVELGKIQLNTKENQIKLLEPLLEKIGFKVIIPRSKQCVDQTKEALNKLFSDEFPFDQGWKFSTWIALELNMEYLHIQEAFKKELSISPENYFIHFRIEKSEYLLKYSSLTGAEISRQLGFSSPAHFSAQFHEIIGMTPNKYREQFK